MSLLPAGLAACAQISKLNEEKQALEDRCDELEGALKKRDEDARALRREVEALRRGGDAGEALGDSLYEARIFVRGSVAGLGADCIEKEMRDEHAAQVRDLLERAGIDDAEPAEFRRYGSARQLYTFKIDNAGAY